MVNGLWVNVYSVCFGPLAALRVTIGYLYGACYRHRSPPAAYSTFKIYN